MRCCVNYHGRKNERNIINNWNVVDDGVNRLD